MHWIGLGLALILISESTMAHVVGNSQWCIQSLTHSACEYDEEAKCEKALELVQRNKGFFVPPDEKKSPLPPVCAPNPRNKPDFQ